MQNLIEGSDSDNERQQKRYIKTKLVTAADLMDIERIEEIKSEIDKGSISSYH